MSEHSFAAIESLLHTNTIALSAFGTWLITFLGGENGALLAILLGLEGLYPLGVAIVFSFLGSLSADVFWYWMTTGAIRPWFERRFKKYFSGTHEKNARSFFVLADKHPYLLLTLIKFLVGIRLVLTIYIIATKRIPFRTFLFFDVLANVLFISVLFGLAWFLGQSLEHALNAEMRISYIVILIVVAAVCGNVLFRVVQRLLYRMLR